MFKIINNPKVRNEKGHIFKCSLYTNGLKIEDEL